ncbi:hypothetical protein NKL07_21950 [Mesorhizobium sp. C280B]|uniref:hypothetical protein n=1 Tax=unclassified Mesorhizobium TaxID=325217 RepID=UPI0012EB8D58|nr:hypothetical protein [Mesorhizobium sp. LSJC280B00]
MLNNPNDPWDWLPFFIMVVLVSIGGFFSYRTGGREVRRRKARHERMAARLDVLFDIYKMEARHRDEIMRYMRYGDQFEIQVSKASYSMMTIMAAVLGVLSLALTLFFWFRRWLHVSSLFVSTAFAQSAVTPPPEAAKPDLGWMIPYVALMVIAIIGIAFLGSIGVLWVTKDTPENQAKLKSASDMVKMFGGFFTGIATTLLAPH